MSSRPGFGRGRGGLSGGIQFIKSKESLPGEILKQPTEGSEAKCFPEPISFDIQGQGNEKNDSKSSVTSPKSLLSLPTAPSRSFNNSGSDRSFNNSGSDRGRGGGSFRGGGSSRFDNQRQSRYDAPCSRNDRSQLSRNEYYRLWKDEKDSILVKFRKLAHEITSLTTSRPNAIDKIMSACNRVPMRVEFNTEPVTSNFKQTASKYMCFVYMDGVFVSTGQGLKLKDAKLSAYEQALDKVLMEFLRVVKVDPTAKELETSSRQFTRDPPEPSKVPLPKNTSLIPPSRRINTDIGNQPQGLSSASSLISKKKFSDKGGVSSGMSESNMDVATMKRRHNEYKPVEDFVIVEPLIPIPDCTPAHTLRRSADFNHMLLEYEYFFKGGPNSMGCVCKLENVPLANVRGSQKIDAKNSAAEVAITKLREICWIIKTKQACDSDVKISKEDMLNEMTEQSAEIKKDNVGHKMLSKMGWTGGGVGKDGTGISKPVELQSTLNRQGLGLSSSKGITDDFRKKVREMIEEYTASGKQDDLVFNQEFRMDERMIIHDECRKFNLKSKSKGKGKNRYLVARRKRSAFELFDMIMSCGGETARYKIVPPGNQPQGQGRGMPGPPQGGGNFSQQQSSRSGGNQGNAPKWNNKNSKLFNNDSSSDRFDRNSGNGSNQGSFRNSGNGSNQGSFEGGNRGGQGNNSWNQNQSDGNSQQNFGNNQGNGSMMEGGFNQGYGGAQNNFDTGQNSYGGGNDNMGAGQNNFGEGQNNYGGGQNDYGGGQNNYGGGQNNMCGGQNNMGGGQNNMGGGGQNNMGGGQNNMGGGQNMGGIGQNNMGGGGQNMGGSGQNNMGGSGQNMNWGQNNMGGNQNMGGSQNNMGGSQTNFGGAQNNGSNSYGQWQQNGQFQGQGSQNAGVGNGGAGGQSDYWQ